MSNSIKSVEEVTEIFTKIWGKPASISIYGTNIHVEYQRNLYLDCRDLLKLCNELGTVNISTDMDKGETRYSSWTADSWTTTEFNIDTSRWSME